MEVYVFEKSEETFWPTTTKRSIKKNRSTTKRPTQADTKGGSREHRYKDTHTHREREYRIHTDTDTHADSGKFAIVLYNKERRQVLFL